MSEPAPTRPDELAQLRHSEQRFRAAVQAVSGIMWTNDAQGRMTGVQEGWSALTGQTEADYTGYGWADAVHPDDAAPTVAAWNAAVATRTPFVFEHRVRRRDGVWRMFAIRAVPVIDEAGALREWIGVHTDITEQRANEAALRRLNDDLGQEVRERTRERDRVWEVSRELICLADPHGRLLRVNPAWTCMLGWPPDDLLGRDSLELVHPEDADATRDALLNLAFHGRPALTLSNRYRTRDGAYRWIAWSLIADEGRVYGIGRDVTAEREAAAALARTEEQLRQSQKMEAVGQLTGGIAHDFNNLLTVIAGGLELAQTRIEAGRGRDAIGLLQAAMSAAQRAGSLTHRLLSFARRQALDPSPTDVNELVRSMSELLIRTLGDAIRLELRLDPAPWLALCDANQLENALLNLVINARDAMPAGGRLVVGTDHAEIDDIEAAAQDELTPGSYVVLTVTDEGVGMSAALQQRVFEPFFTTKPLGQGTGLGLSMLYGFVKQSRGHVTVTSAEGQGASFRICLPRHIES